MAIGPDLGCHILRQRVTLKLISSHMKGFVHLPGLAREVGVVT